MKVTKNIPSFVGHNKIIAINELRKFLHHRHAIETELDTSMRSLSKFVEEIRNEETYTLAFTNDAKSTQVKSAGSENNQVIVIPSGFIEGMLRVCLTQDNKLSGGYRTNTSVFIDALDLLLYLKETDADVVECKDTPMCRKLSRYGNGSYYHNSQPQAIIAMLSSRYAKDNFNMLMDTFYNITNNIHEDVYLGDIRTINAFPHEVIAGEFIHYNNWIPMKEMFN